MKKKLLICLGILTSLSLTSCDVITDLFNGGGHETYSYRSGTPSKNPFFSNGNDQSPTYSDDNSNTSYSYTPGDTIEALPANCNYMDFIRNNVYNLSSAPCVGEANLLVIPVWFNDSSTFISASRKENVRQDIEAAYFGTDEETGWKSVKAFYEEESHGALTVNGKVTSWYEPNKNYSYYTVDDDTSRTIALTNAATSWYFSNNPSDPRTNYDKDRDGYLDGVLIIYAAPDYVAFNRDNYTNLWAYCFWTQDSSARSLTSPGANAFFWASYDFMYSKSDAFTRTFASNYGHGDTSHCIVDAHTYIHEMGHMFGLEDYYDYSTNEYDPAGAFSMQDQNVGGHDPFSCYALGWGKAYSPVETTTINLKPFTESGEMILLSPDLNPGSRSPFDEYILLEYYTPTGLNQFDVTNPYCNNGPAGATASGIRVWHVDARLLYYSDNPPYNTTVTTDPNKAGGTVTIAMSNTYNDGRQDTQGYLSPLGSGNYNYNILQMIRNNTTINYKPAQGNGLSNANLFKAGESFSTSTFSKQFVNSGKLNTKKDLGFSFRVNSLDTNFASITVTKL